MHISYTMHICTPNTTILHTLPTITQHPPAVAVNNYASLAGPALPHALAETTTSSMATIARVSHTPFLPVCKYPAAQLFCFLCLLSLLYKTLNSNLSPSPLPPFIPLASPSDPAPHVYISSKTVVAPFKETSGHWSRSQQIGIPYFNITASAIDIDYREFMLYWISSVDKVR